MERNGIDVLTGNAPVQAGPGFRPTRLHPILILRQNINLKAIDHIDGRPAVRQLTTRRLTEIVTHEAWRGPGTVEIRPNAQLPVFCLPVIENAGRIFSGALTLRWLLGKSFMTISRDKHMSTRVVVTDCSFPDVVQERQAAESAGRKL